MPSVTIDYLLGKPLLHAHKSTDLTDFSTAVQTVGDARYVELGGDTMTGNLIFSGSQKIIGGTGTTADLTFQTTSGVGATGANMHFLVGNNGATEAMTILNSGSVGIGTTAPVGILHLYNAAAATRLAIDGDAGQNRLISYRTGALQRFGLYVNNTAESGSNAGSNFSIRAYSDAGTLLSTPFFINRATGNVGIGTTSPGQPLDVNGIARIRSSIQWGNTQQGNLTFSGTDAYIDAANSGGSLIFRTNGSTEAFRVNSSGNVGIGTTNPTAYLHIVGDTGATTHLKFVGNDISGSTGFFGTTTGTPTGTGLAGGEGPTCVFGFEGGTTKYNYAGNLLGRMAFQGQANDNSYLGARLESYVETGGNITRSSAEANLVFLIKSAGSVSPTEKVRITSAGNVGIGTTSPAVRLDVVGANSAEGQLYVGNTDATYAAGINFITSGTNRGFVGWRHTYSTAPFNLTGIHLFNTDNSNIVFGTNNLVRAVIDTNGNVGIGTTSPAYLFHILKNDSTASDVNLPQMAVQNSNTSVSSYALIKTLVGTGYAGGYPELWMQSFGGTSGLNTIRGVSNHDLSFTTNDAERMRIRAGGNVGIGTTTPGYKLEVSGDINLPAGNAYRVGGTAGVSGTFTTVNSKTVTVTKGIITSIV